MSPSFHNAERLSGDDCNHRELDCKFFRNSEYKHMDLAAYLKRNKIPLANWQNSVTLVPARLCE